MLACFVVGIPLLYKTRVVGAWMAAMIGGGAFVVLVTVPVVLVARVERISFWDLHKRTARSMRADALVRLDQLRAKFRRRHR